MANRPQPSANDETSPGGMNPRVNDADAQQLVQATTQTYAELEWIADAVAQTAADMTTESPERHRTRRSTMRRR